MAILCIRVAPNGHPTDPSLNPLRTQPGDVVCIVEDGHVFSVAERTCGQYRFLTVLGVAADFAHFVTPVFQGDVFPEFPNETERLIRCRNVSLDPASLSVGAWRARTTATRAQIDAITVTRT